MNDRTLAKARTELAFHSYGPPRGRRGVTRQCASKAYWKRAYNRAARRLAPDVIGEYLEPDGEPVALGYTRCPCAYCAWEAQRPGGFWHAGYNAWVAAAPYNPHNDRFARYFPDAGGEWQAWGEWYCRYNDDDFYDAFDDGDDCYYDDGPYPYDRYEDYLPSEAEEDDRLKRAWLRGDEAHVHAYLGRVYLTGDADWDATAPQEPPDAPWVVEAERLAWHVHEDDAAREANDNEMVERLVMPSMAWPYDLPTWARRKA